MSVGLKPDVPAQLVDRTLDDIQAQTEAVDAAFFLESYKGLEDADFQVIADAHPRFKALNTHVPLNQSISVMLSPSRPSIKVLYGFRGGLGFGLHDFNQRPNLVSMVHALNR